MALPPTLNSVTSSTANGEYRIGDVIAVQLNFSDAVTVTGAPQLTLETGAIDRVATYASGSGTSTLTFTYTVQSGDTTADLDYVSPPALALNGGTIRDADGADAALILPSPGAANSLGANKNIVIDGVAPTVSGVTSSTSNGSYGIGDLLSIRVNFSEIVSVTGTPQLTLETGATDRAVNYVSGSGTNSLVFNYVVQSGDTAADLDYVSTSALALNGGAIRDVAGNSATLTLASPGAANSLGANKNIIVDAVAPTVTGVTASTPDGAYRAGQTISIRVGFTEAVLVQTTGGTPSLALSNGASAVYALGSGTNTLTFEYTVQAGDTVQRLDYSGAAALALNGATIRDATRNSAGLTLPAPGADGSLAANKAIELDTTAPTLTITSSATVLRAGQTATITFNFSEDPGATFIWDGASGDVVVNGGTLSAISGAGATRTAIFTPTSSVDNGTASITVAAGSYADRAGNAGGAGAAPSLDFDTHRPNVTGLLAVPANGTYGVGETLEFTVAFDQNVSLSGTASVLQLNLGGVARNASYSSKTANSITYQYTVQPGDIAGAGVAVGAIDLGGDTLSDPAGNQAVLSLAGHLPSTAGVLIDAVAPNVASVAAPSNGAYRAGQVLSFTVAFDENVTVTGTDSVLTLNIGGETRQAVFAAQTGNTIRYDYTVQAGDVDADGIALGALSLGASTIRDGAGNAASLSLAGHTPSLSGVLVDTTAPAAPSAPDMAASSDTGTSNSDNITKNTTPTFTGSAESGSTVTLYDTDGATVLGAGVASGGTWSITPLSAMSPGSHTVTAKAADMAGNISTASAGLTLTVDTTAPTVAITSNVSSLKAGETATITFTFSEDPGPTLTWDGSSGDVTVSGGTLGAISGSGLTRTATFTPTANTNGGTASITVAASSYADVAGNTGGAGVTPSLTFDTLRPSAPSTPDLAAASDTGASNSDNITDVRTPIFSGSAEAGAMVRLYASGSIVGSAIATGGAWTITASTLGTGSHAVTATATDLAGNVSAASLPLSLTIRDNRAPTGTVSFTGAAKVGGTLTAANTLADADGLGAISYQWRRDGVDIAGETNTTYTLVGADAGARVGVVARYTDLLATSESVASTTALVSSADIAAPLVVVTPQTISAAAGATVTISGSILGSSALTFDGGGLVVITAGGAYSGTATVAGGTLSVNGALPNATVVVGSGGTLAGTGTVGTTTVGSGGVLATGNSPGVLHTANLALATGAAFNVEIASASSYDQADVTGTVNLGGATLNLSALGGFTPQLGHVYTIVQNDGTDAVTGAFAGLAQGATVSLGGVQLTISYRGGDGNDVTLSAPAAPAPPPAAGGGTTPPPSLVANANRALGFDINSAKAASPTVVDPSGKVQANPNHATALAVQAVQADYGAGKITAAQASAKLIDLALPTKGVAIESYLFFTGGAPTSAGMAYLVDSDANPTDLTDPYYAVFNMQNRYINFAVNLGANGEGRAAFAQAYGTLTFEQAIAKAYEAVIGVGAARAAGYDTTAGMAYVNGQKGYFEALGGSDIGAKAAMVGYLLSVSSDIHLGGYYQAAAGLIGEQIGLIGGASAF